MSIYRQKLMLTQNHNGFSVKNKGVLTRKHGHGLEESAGDPRGGGVAQGRGLPEPRRPEVSRVRVVAGVEAGQIGAVGSTRAPTDTTAGGWTPVDIIKTNVFHPN